MDYFPGLDDYEGPLPLFPLPSVVFFPRTFLPLRVFEPRYRQMVKDSVEKDALIGVVLLKPGWEKTYYENPPVYPVGCVGKMVEIGAYPDGRLNILLYGLNRVKLRTIQQEKLYRTARVEVLHEHPSQISPRKESRLRREIFEALSRVLDPPHWGFSVLSAPHLELGALVDMIAFSLPLDIGEKQGMLEAVPQEARVRELLRILEEEEGKGKRLRVKQLPFLHELARN